MVRNWIKMMNKFIFLIKQLIYDFPIACSFYIVNFWYFLWFLRSEKSIYLMLGKAFSAKSPPTCYDLVTLIPITHCRSYSFAWSQCKIESPFWYLATFNHLYEKQMVIFAIPTAVFKILLEFHHKSEQEQRLFVNA